MNHRPSFEGRTLVRPHEDLEDQGLRFDLGTVFSRRKLLGLFGLGVGGVALAACAPGGGGTQASGTTAASTSSAAAATLTEMNSETAGPYPGDGSNGPDVLEISGIERSDIRSSLEGDMSVAGVPITLSMNLIDLTADNAPIVGAAVYVWHCDGLGRYSMYGTDVTEETFLRGVQISDETGQVTFTSIVPGCYAGRWPHIHFEVFPDRGSITDAGNNILTSQIAIPEKTCAEVYGGAAYERSADKLSNITLARDGIFRDGWEQQMAKVSGDATSGYTMTIDVPIKATTA